MGGIAVIVLDTHIWVWWVAGTFRRDPADQLIVATARVYDCPLLTADGRILNYASVKTLT